MPTPLRLSLCAVIAIAASLSGCAALQGQPQGDYSASEFSTGMQAQSVQLGTVVAVQPVLGLGGSTAGQIVGAIGGGLLGSTVGHGSGSDLVAAVGALAGAGVGGYAEQHAMARQALEVTVRLKSGRVIGVVESDYSFQIGEAVQVVRTAGNGGLGGSQGTTRVLPLSQEN